MERGSCGATKRVGFDVSGADLASDDVIVLGALPRESVTIDIRILVHEAFNGTTPAFDLGYYNYNSGTFISIASITTAALDAADFQIVVPMPVTGNINLAGAAYTGTSGGIWNGKKETVLAIEWKGGAMAPTTGQCDIVTTHTYFGTKDGKYGLARVPMTI